MQCSRKMVKNHRPIFWERHYYGIHTHNPIKGVNEGELLLYWLLGTSVLKKPP